MARTRYKFFDDDCAPYFITASIVNWLPLFSNPEIASILIETLRYLICQQRIRLYAYVIMENHVHLIAESDDLAREVANFKSYTARKSIDYYQKQNNQYFLDQLAYLKLPHRKDRPYQFWQEGSHPQRIMNEAMFEQKVEYIHNNPVSRGYVDLPEHWRYSSARNYYGMAGLLPVEGIDE